MELSKKASVLFHHEKSVPSEFSSKLPIGTFAANFRRCSRRINEWIRRRRKEYDRSIRAWRWITSFVSSVGRWSWLPRWNRWFYVDVALMRLAEGHYSRVIEDVTTAGRFWIMSHVKWVRDGSSRAGKLSVSRENPVQTNYVFITPPARQLHLFSFTTFSSSIFRSLTRSLDHWAKAVTKRSELELCDEQPLHQLFSRPTDIKRLGHPCHRINNFWHTQPTALKCLVMRQVQWYLMTRPTRNIHIINKCKTQIVPISSATFLRAREPEMNLQTGPKGALNDSQRCRLDKTS